jgi:hypothetical protein
VEKGIGVRLRIFSLMWERVGRFDASRFGIYQLRNFGINTGF